MAGCKTDFLCTLQIGAKWPWAKWAEIIKLIVHTWWSHLSSLMTTTWAAAAVPGDFCFLLLSLSPNRYDKHIRIKLVTAITKRQRATILVISTRCSICLEMLWITVIYENTCCRIVMCPSFTVMECTHALFCTHFFLLGNNAFSVLRYTIKVTYTTMLHCFEIHYALELLHRALLRCCLAAPW